MIKYNMDPLFNKYVELLNYILQEEAKKKSFTNVKDRMIWERGYLTGLLASLARNDSDVAFALRKKLKK
jgi:uncharacterized protein YbgA (DUF1722 family)